MCYQITIDPRDRLFFRDAKPISGSDVGGGANWPLPSLFHSAFISALYEKWPLHQSWEQPHTGNDSDKNSDKSRMRFGGLKTYGVFPQKDGIVYVPTPADIAPDGSIMELIKLTGASNLPLPLKFAVSSTGAPSKKEVQPWISMENLEKYLKGETGLSTFPGFELYGSETAPGIEINPATMTNVEGIFFQAVYMRLQKDVSMLAFAECESKKYNEIKGVDILQKLFEEGKSLPFVFGGQRGMAFMECRREKTALCKITDSLPNVSGNRIKWTLLSPALFNKGWLPDWIDSGTGKVMLKSRPDKNGKSRKEWRKEIENAPQINANIVAARLPKPLVHSGWKLDKDTDCAGGGPKATRLAVPAGSVYYFECDNADEAKKLSAELHGTVKSSLLGEQGFGLGVCSSYTIKTTNGDTK